MMMTTSPAVLSHPHTHSPLNRSPAGSPSLRPLSSAAPPPLLGMSKTASPGGSGTATPLGPLPTQDPSSSHRSYARQPTQRPYMPLLVARGNSASKTVQAVTGATRDFGDIVADKVTKRTLEARSGRHGSSTADHDEEDGGVGFQARKGRSLGPSLAGSWEMERAELIVDVPVWSPGCFQDLSTLHALRDTTLSHTHSILAHLLTQHSIPASYRLLARSAVASQTTTKVGWGCIRLAPSVTSPVASHSPLKPKYRRSSFVHEGENARRTSRSPIAPQRPPLHSANSSSAVLDGGLVEISFNPLGSKGPALPTRMSPILAMEQALADESDEDEAAQAVVQLREGYRSSSVSDEEEEEETADVIVAREVEKRGAKEGDIFLMTLFGGPALILT